MLKKQQPVDSFFNRLNIGDPRAYGMHGIFLTSRVGNHLQ